jgi:hypothetical protein
MLLDKQDLRVIREPYIAEKAVFVGGHPGCGKTMLTPIVGSFARVEIQKFNYVLEHICSLHFLGKIPEDAATAILRMLVDMDLYNMAMSRETNFRFSDLSSVFKNPGTWRYIRRLFQPGDATVIERIRKEKPILQITTHDILVLSPALFKALDGRLRVVEVVRHPLYMIKQWYLYIERYGTDVRDFTVWFEYQGHSLPYFARGWEEKYLQANPMDKVIYSIEHLSLLGERVMQNLSEHEKKQVMIVPFERFVLNPWPYLRDLEYLLGTPVTASTRRELKRQNVPRKMITDGIPEPIYKQYGWEAPERGADERRELKKRKQFAASLASPEGMRVLDRMCEEYEKKYPR